MDTQDKPSKAARVSSAVFFGLSSMLIVVVNKLVLTSYRFPSYQVLALGQISMGLFILRVGKLLGYITFPEVSTATIKEVWPLPVIYMCNLLFGLGGTKKLSLPMFTVLRRFSILFTMIGEYYILNVPASMSTQVSVFLMIFGAVVAGLSDLAFNAVGYMFLFANDVTTAANGVYTKKKLGAKGVGKYGLMYHNFIFMILPTAALVLYQSEELEKVKSFPKWSDPLFCAGFLTSCIMGFVLNYSIMLCTAYNSALTTTVTGVIKNLAVTYGGMFLGGDYVFSVLNLIGINISVAGSIIYSYFTFTQKSPPKPNKEESSELIELIGVTEEAKT